MVNLADRLSPMSIAFLCILIPSAFLIPVVDAKPAPSPTVTHIHELHITDLKGNPLDSVNVSIVATDSVDNEGHGYNKRTLKDTVITTLKDGIVLIKVNTISHFSRESRDYAFKTTVSYNVQKTGFYNAKYSTIDSKSYLYREEQKVYDVRTRNKVTWLYEDVGIRVPKVDLMQTVVDTLKLYKPTDFFAEAYLSSIEGTELKSKILAFIDNIRMEGLLGNSYLLFNSIDVHNFKSNKYLSFSFINDNVYNSLKLSKYDVGKRLFDEVVRKVLNPLNSNISNSKDFFGYDITVFGKIKDFSDKNAASIKLTYQFLMPITSVSKYKDKEITGQGLIDSSVISLDDERIDLKLQ
jgi:hypothetical protein